MPSFTHTELRRPGPPAPGRLPTPPGLRIGLSLVLIGSAGLVDCAASEADGSGGGAATSTGGSGPSGPYSSVVVTVTGGGKVDLTSDDPAQDPASCSNETSPCALSLAGRVTLSATPAAQWAFENYLDTGTSQVLTAEPTYVVEPGSNVQVTALFLVQATDGGAGGCGPGSGGTPECPCPNGVCPQDVATGLPSAAGLRVAAGHLYYLGSISRVPTSGGPAETIVPGTVATFAVDDAVYWIDGSATSVKSVGLDGVGPTSLGSADGLSHPQAIAADATDLYWMTLSNGAEGTCVAVVRMPKAGGSVTKVSETCDKTQAIVPYGLAVDDANVYFSTVVTPSFSDGFVYRADKTAENGQKALVGNGNSAASRITVHGENVYWLQDGIMRAPIAGGDANVVGTQHPISAFAVDDSGIYYGGDEGVYRVDEASGQATHLAYDAASEVALDAQSVYFAAGAPGSTSIEKLPKP